MARPKNDAREKIEITLFGDIFPFVRNIQYPTGTQLRLASSEEVTASPFHPCFFLPSPPPPPAADTQRANRTHGDSRRRQPGTERPCERPGRRAGGCRFRARARARATHTEMTRFPRSNTIRRARASATRACSSAARTAAPGQRSRGGLRLDKDRGTSIAFICLGCVTFLPGVYVVFNLVQVLRGAPGFHLSDFAHWDDYRW
ncbi:unnamed protein product [Chondrus crispus]|uniref:Uncharacterized protein n=1 Tax=Chondrus crispus TaxID=2769 RepID=R7Q6F0_CHOCR|nr:unnamed protein product [Chondrus crispus]CDF33418.1 unnamed protein product [Chondrus crispus]|eukprot:XP_005713221.1 unnamed protein product [Chondrus crispus]